MPRFSFLFAVLVCFFGILSGIAYAQNNAGITLRPATISENVDPGAVKQYSFTVRNESGSDQQYYLSARDIVGVEDGNVPIFAKEGMEKTAYELSQWVALETETLFVTSGAEAVVNFTVTVPGDAAPGGHFAGVFVSMEPPRLRESGAAIGYEVANIISLRVAGEVDERAEIRQFATDNYVYGKPEVEFSVRVENSGNTLIRPLGPIEITNMFGRRVDDKKLIFNDQAGGVFPRSTRDFTVMWKGEPPGFGRYEAVISAAYGEENARQTMTSTVSFWILPMGIIMPAAGVLAAVLLLTYGMARWYVSRKLAYYTATGTGRRLVRRRQDSGSPIVLILVVLLSVTALFLIAMIALFA